MSTVDYTDRVIALMFAFSRFMRSKMAEAARKDHVNWVQIHALFLIQERDGMTMKELAHSLVVTAPTATSFVNRLVRDGLVARQADPKNRKLVRLGLTPKGAKLIRVKISQRQAIIREFVSALPIKDQRDLIRILERVLHTSPGTV